VTAIENSEKFEQFAAAIRADDQPVSTIEEELVARLKSLLWRLRRATLIETNLFQLQGRLAMEQKLRGQRKSDSAGPGLEILYRLLRSPDTVVPSQPTSNTPGLTNHGPDVANA
jgi:hypothetical protein